MATPQKQQIMNELKQNSKKLIAEIPSELHYKIKMLAAENNLTIKDIVNNSLMMYISNRGTSDSGISMDKATTVRSDAVSR